MYRDKLLGITRKVKLCFSRGVYKLCCYVYIYPHGSHVFIIAYSTYVLLLAALLPTVSLDVYIATYVATLPEINILIIFRSPGP